MHKLYLVATPIGHLEDITLRALRILKEVSLIAAEDTRKAQVLLTHYDIKTPVTSFFEANEYRKTPVILNALEQGDVALISEAGMPGISDPGYPLITAAIEQGISIVPVPGPSAHTAALVVSGLPMDRFLFVGFLPRKHAEPALEDLATFTSTMVFYEAPHRLRATLEAMHAILGNRRLSLCRELTKLHEEIWRGDLAQALVRLDTHPPRGEYTLVVAGASEEDLKWSEPRVRQALLDHMTRGLSRSSAAREVASLSGWSRRRIYDLPVDRDQAETEKP
jgi:16S rRNA (cytidine1402-2'-O)-methyltransferase